MDAPSMITNSTLLNVAGDPLGKPHCGHTDVRSETFSDGAFVPVDYVGFLQGVLHRWGRVVLHYQATGPLAFVVNY